jgi:hypothetical protein
MSACASQPEVADPHRAAAIAAAPPANRSSLRLVADVQPELFDGCRLRKRTLICMFQVVTPACASRLVMIACTVVSDEIRRLLDNAPARASVSGYV